MSDRPSNNLDGLEIDLAHRIDEVCRRFEADWRKGHQPRIDDYMVDLADEGRPALRAELEALDRELRQSDETVARPDAVRPSAPERQTAPSPSKTAESPTIVPGPLPTAPFLGAAPLLVHQGATLPPRNQPRSPHDQPTAAVLAHDPSATPGAAERTHIHYFGDYEIIGEIARGGMGVVFRARQVSLNRTVALKMILAGQLADDSDVKRFHSEAEAAANLDHPGIVPIFEVGQHEGQHYFSMGFVEGQSLSQRLASGPLPSREAAELIRRVSEAIEYAHQHGVIHRDLKPANILLDQNGNPRVTDFGLAKKVQGDSGLTGSGQIMGTPSYMPPEQAGGPRGEVGPAADVYSLGATLYALVTGRPPFQAATPMDTVIQVISDEPVSPRRLNASVPLDVETICLKCLEKEQGKRYRSATALAGDLRRYLAGEPILARSLGQCERAWRWCRRQPVVASLAGGIVLALFLGTVVATFFAVRASRNADTARANLKFANQETARANQEAQHANQDAQKATGEALRADREAQAARYEKGLSDRRLYVAHLNLAQQAWQDGFARLFRENLEANRPRRGGDVDLRGFEWYYLDRLRELQLQTLRGHGSVAYSPDGRTLASAGSDNTVKLWDAATTQEIRTLSGHSGAVTDVKFSPDGRTLASADTSGNLKLWDVATGNETRTLRCHDGVVHCIAYSPDGRTIASTTALWAQKGPDDTVKLWDAATGNEVRTIRGHGASVRSLAYSPDGRTLASTSYDLTVKLWDAATGAEIRTLRGHNGAVSGVTYSPDGRTLASASADWSVKLWDAATGKEIRTLVGHNGGFTGVTYSPCGRTLASADTSGNLRLWDVATGKEIHSLRGHESLVSAVAYSPDGRTIASSGSGGVKLWAAGTSEEVLNLRGHKGSVNYVMYSRDGRTLASASSDKTVRLWNTHTTQQVLVLRGHKESVNSVAFSPDGVTIASASSDRTVRLWETATGKEIRTLRTDADAVYGVAYCPDSRTLASTDSGGNLTLWEAASGRVIRRLRGALPHAGAMRYRPAGAVMYSPDGRTLASADDLGNVRLWDAASGGEVHTLRGQSKLVRALAYSPDGRTLAFAGTDNTVEQWDATTGRHIVTLRGHGNMVGGVAYSPDGRRVASSGRDKTVRLWDLITKQAVLILHSDSSSNVAFSSDGRQLASGSSDGTVTIWDATPMTPELRVLREARSVVDFLFAQPLSVAEVYVRIRRDPTISTEVRQHALELANAHEQSLANDEADVLVQSLFDKLLLKDDVLENLRAETALSEPVREQALVLAKHSTDDPTQLNNVAWAVVRRPDADATAYRRALRVAEAACRLAPNNGIFLNTLGVAQYRIEKYQEAAATLTSSDRLNAQPPLGPIPADLAFLALVQHRLGQTETARDTLRRLREAMKKPQHATDPEAAGFLREAEAIDRDLVFPADPFAR